MKIVITGASGLIGRRLITELQKQGHFIHALVRNKNSVSELPESQVFTWDTFSNSFPLEAISGMHAVIHLAGGPIAEGRWTRAKKERIQKSRWIGTKNLVSAIGSLPQSLRPKIFLSASAIGLYGHTGDNMIDESAPAGQGFLADTVLGWEEEAKKAAELHGLRVCLLRLGVVLAPDGGALAKMAPVVLGNGKQWLSWIHIEDLIAFIKVALDNEKARGAFNLTSPEPVQNRKFTQVYACAIGFPLTLWAPKAVVKLVLGEMADETILSSQRIVSRRLTELDFKFKYTTIEQALAEIYKR